MKILGNYIPAMVDTGAHRNVCGFEGTQRLKRLGFKARKLNYKQPPAIGTAGNSPHKITHCFYIPVHIDGMFSVIEIFSAPTHVAIRYYFRNSFHP